MIGLREITYSLYGAYRLCRFDSGGLSYLNTTIEGFWRSFFSAVLIAPLHFLIVALGFDPTPAASLWRIIVIEALTYVILVFAYPVIVHSVCQLLDRRGRYVSYIVAYNWANVIQMALVFPVALLAASGLVPVAVTDVAQLAVTAVTLAMFWYIAKAALQVPGLTAAALVVIDVVLGLIVHTIADGRLSLS
ncbi:MAG TPA: hypothetical protein VKY65_10340 [Alphaproteobacteria bacterium]|nr:hypothetical protein [Alphaproteobacteria bacterium]